MLRAEQNVYVQASFFKTVIKQNEKPINMEEQLGLGMIATAAKTCRIICYFNDFTEKTTTV